MVAETKLSFLRVTNPSYSEQKIKLLQCYEVEIHVSYVTITQWLLVFCQQKSLEFQKMLFDILDDYLQHVFTNMDWF